ncbi:hypothetical protein I79_013166 [Cricetulus griseus]|uniref:Uncharacterized protein n=1 Tax=Cricetulus griseus TaxID=10029 RepID=G3HQR0_CRIGR|nr:hypothetical protein I79_013166 [Cricetulus griseus]
MPTSISRVDKSVVIERYTAKKTNKLPLQTNLGEISGFMKEARVQNQAEIHGRVTLEVRLEI